MKIKRIGGGKTRAYSDLTTRPSQITAIAAPAVNTPAPEPMKVKGGRGGKRRGYRRLRTRTPKKPLTKAERAANLADAMRRSREYKAKKEAEFRKNFSHIAEAEDARIAAVGAAQQQRRDANRARKQAESDRAAAAASAAAESERQKRQQDEARAAEMRAAAAKPKPRPKPAEYEPPTPAPDYTSGMIVGF